MLEFTPNPISTGRLVFSNALTTGDSLLSFSINPPVHFLSFAVGSSINTFLGLLDTPDAYTGQAGQAVTVNAGETGLDFTAISTGGRELLIANRTYFVRTTGSDVTGDGLTAGTAFATVTYAFDFVERSIDASYFRITFDIGPGNWSGGPFVLSTQNTTTVRGAGSANTSISLWASSYTEMNPQALTFDAAMGDGFAGLYCGEYSEVVCGDDIAFATAGGGSVDVFAYDYGACTMNADWTVSGSKAAFFKGTAYGRFNTLGVFNVTMVGNPNIDHFFDLQDHMRANWNQCTSSGASTGSRYRLSSLLCAIRSPTLADLNTIPGNAAGTIVTNPMNAENLAAYATSTTSAGAVAVFDGGGSVLSPGVALDLPVPFNCTITEVNMYAQQTGNLVVDVWKDTHGSFPPTVLDTITAAAKPTITASNKSQDSTLTGWSTTINAGDILRFNIDSVSSIQRATVILEVLRT